MRLSPFIIAGVLCLAAQSSRADTHTLAKAGAWTAFTGTTNAGRAECGISSVADDGRYFGLKSFAGEDSLTIQLGLNKMAMVDDSKNEIVMQFDATTPWRATAYGMHFGDGDSGLEYDIAHKDLAVFLRQFRNSSQLVIRLAESGAVVWTSKLAKTPSIADSFDHCVANLQK